MINRLKSAAKPFLTGLARRVQKYRTFSESLDSLCMLIHQAHTNFNYDHETNGERWLIERLVRNNALRTAFDVGANRGDWTALLLRLSPPAHVHCFEICPPTFERLRTRFAASPNVTLNAVGLSDGAGEVNLAYSSDCDGLSSMVEIVCAANSQSIKAQVTTGLLYCSQHSVTRIDLLKIDVEGAEHLVLKGFGDLLQPDRIPVVQFEYGMVNIASRFLLRDFYELFTRRGYRVGKLYSNFVKFRPYRFEDEDFRGPNFVAASPSIARLLEDGAPA
jgi:FkbM family methyltransferase